jgi:4-hydroxybenzoate polyprenyltransferase
MKLVTAFFRLIRWPNLVFIVVTQLLFYYCIILPLTQTAYLSSFLTTDLPYLLLFTFSSVLIAAAGYIINDYFDLNIDRINKPEKLVVEKIIKRRWAIIWHWVLSFAGILIGIVLSFKSGNWMIALSNITCVILLWFYSTSFKKKLLIGNVVISLLTAWVILVFIVFWYGIPVSIVPGWHTVIYSFDTGKLFKLTILYAGFAFIISLIREVIKDLEDMEGDARYGCKTMPIVWGIPATKVFTAVWIIVLVSALVIIQFYALHLRWWWSIVYSVVTIIIPLLWILRKLYRAQVAKDYHRLSTAVKLVMLAGILSMIFFKIYS